MAASASHILWGFAWYARHNPYKSMDNMTERDFINMLNLYASANNSESSIDTSDPGTYTSVYFPDATVTGGTISAAQTTAACDQANYPEKSGVKGLAPATL